MVDIIKVNMDSIWAVEGDRVPPDAAKVKTGWGIELVPRQWLNWISYRQDNNIAYLFQKGIPEWDATTEYLTNKSYVQHGDIVYKSLIGSTGKNPITNPTNWVKAFGSGDDSLTDYLKVIRDTPIVANTLQYLDAGKLAKTTPLTGIGRNIIGSATVDEVKATLGLGNYEVDVAAAKQAAIEAKQSEDNAKASELAAADSATQALTAKTDAQTAAGQSLSARDSSEAFAVDSLASATRAQADSLAASTSAAAAKVSENEAIAAVAEMQDLAFAAVYLTQTLTAGPNIPISNAATIYHATLDNASTTVVMDSTVAVGQSRRYTIILNQGVGGRSVVWPNTIRWANGQSPVLSVAPDAEDVISILHIGGLPYFFGFFDGGSFA